MEVRPREGHRTGGRGAGKYEDFGAARAQSLKGKREENDGRERTRLQETHVQGKEFGTYFFFFFRSRALKANGHDDAATEVDQLVHILLQKGVAGSMTSLCGSCQLALANY